MQSAAGAEAVILKNGDCSYSVVIVMIVIGIGYEWFENIYIFENFFENIYILEISPDIGRPLLRDLERRRSSREEENTQRPELWQNQQNRWRQRRYSSLDKAISIIVITNISKEITKKKNLKSY